MIIGGSIFVALSECLRYFLPVHSANSLYVEAAFQRYIVLIYRLVFAAFRLAGFIMLSCVR